MPRHSLICHFRMPIAELQKQAVPWGRFLAFEICQTFGRKEENHVDYALDARLSALRFSAGAR